MRRLWLHVTEAEMDENGSTLRSVILPSLEAGLTFKIRDRNEKLLQDRSLMMTYPVMVMMNLVSLLLQPLLWTQQSHESPNIPLPAVSSNVLHKWEKVRMVRCTRLSTRSVVPPQLSSGCVWKLSVKDFQSQLFEKSSCYNLFAMTISFLSRR